MPSCSYYRCFDPDRHWTVPDGRRVGLAADLPNLKRDVNQKTTGNGTHEKGQRVPLKTKHTRPNVANLKGARPVPHALKQLTAKADPRQTYIWKSTVSGVCFFFFFDGGRPYAKPMAAGRSAANPGHSLNIYRLPP